MESSGILLFTCLLSCGIASHLPVPSLQGAVYGSSPYYQPYGGRYGGNPGYSALSSYSQAFPQQSIGQPYAQSYGQSYGTYTAGPGYQTYTPPIDENVLNALLVKSYLAQPYTLQSFNVLEEHPEAVSNKFTSVPMIIAYGDSVKLLRRGGQIMEVSKSEPLLTIKTETNHLVEVTPAAKIVLDKPIIATSLKTNILFPNIIEIKHDGKRIPMKVGALVVPVPKGTTVSEDTPVSITVVLAVSTTPLSVFQDYVNENKDVQVDKDAQSVVVESEPNAKLPPKNVTVLNFPEKEAEPNVQVDQDDESLVNRNPPVGVVPAGIVQSTQPHASIQEFHNSKESPFLTQLREEAKKHRLIFENLK